ncbi:hypothetical protein [Pedobacter sp. UBA4863]|mgnify:CR=1 FL=1|uniref:hypothetical protein n=1 Tax=Pedobacter sp. UBA4863 TaxID=1947060 RepID=UPI0025EE5688|nr:hypothetical protein [Pedobacter sp. UBA4863]
MRHIDLSIIENKVKKIPWTVKLSEKYSHLNHLAFKEKGEDFIDWHDIEKFHIAQLEGKSPEDRKSYIKKYPDWNMLKSIFIKEYGNKCWYSEAPLDNGPIDHFRPKNKAINYCLNDSDVNHKFILKKDGYWRLAYNFFNFRLSSNTANSRFDDVEAEGIQIGGKSVYFPLGTEMDGSFIIADNYNDVIAEKALLLDPINPSDYSNIAFDKDGEPFVCAFLENQKIKAEISINLFNLKNTLNFKNERQKLWYTIETVINDTKKYIDNNLIPDEKKIDKQNNCFEVIRKHVEKTAVFSAVAYTCFKVYEVKAGYEFLTHFKP